MRVGLLGMIGAGLALSCAAAWGGADEDLLQRMTKLEQRNEQLERALRTTVGAAENKITAVADKLTKESEKPNDILVSWKNGLKFTSRDKSVTASLGGRLDYDFSWLNEDSDTRMYVLPMTGKAIGDQKDGAELRRLRLSFDFSVYDAFGKIEFDVAGSESAIQDTVDEGGTDTIRTKKFKTGTVALKDVYIGVNALPNLKIQAGHFKEPFSLEELTSARFTTFMERALPNAFVPSRNAGVMVAGTVAKERMTYAAGFFRNVDDRGYTQDEGDGGAFTARVTGVPYYDEASKGRRLIHVGGAASMRNLDSTHGYDSRPEMHLSSRYLDTDDIMADDELLLGGELAGVYGPFSVQSEYMRASIDRKGGSDVDFWGAYVQLSYFLTGENRVYKKSSGTFDRVIPRQSYGQTKDGRRGWGAVEVAGRMSWLDLNDRDIKGGELRDCSLGVNWHLNPNIRVTFNCVHADLDDTAGSEGGKSSLVGLRLHLDF